MYQINRLFDRYLLITTSNKGQVLSNHLQRWSGAWSKLVREREKAINVWTIIKFIWEIKKEINFAEIFKVWIDRDLKWNQIDGKSDWWEIRLMESKRWTNRIGWHSEKRMKTIKMIKMMNIRGNFWKGVDPIELKQWMEKRTMQRMWKIKLILERCVIEGYDISRRWLNFSYLKNDCQDDKTVRHLACLFKSAILDIEMHHVHLKRTTK